MLPAHLDRVLAAQRDARGPAGRIAVGHHQLVEAPADPRAVAALSSLRRADTVVSKRHGAAPSRMQKASGVPRR